MLCDGERAVSDGQRARPADGGITVVLCYDVLGMLRTNGFTSTLWE